MGAVANLALRSPMRPVVLTIAGIDSLGCSGLHADLRSIESAGGWCAAAISAVTAQNSRGVQRVDPTPAVSLSGQLQAVFEDAPVAAVKTGLLPGVEAVEIVADWAAGRARELPWVVDPVLRSSTGAPLVDEPTVQLLAERVLPRATLVTPNVHELAALSGLAVGDPAGALKASQRLLEQGAGAVLAKGGHFEGAGRGVDQLVLPGRIVPIPHRWIDGAATRGGGCTLAASIATGLALGLDLIEAVGQAVERLVEAIEHGFQPGRGEGAVDAAHRLHESLP